MGRIHVAATLGDVSYFRNPNVTSFSEAGLGGKTPLHYAAENGHVNVVKWLLRHLETPDHFNATDESGHTPLHLAALYGRLDVVSELLKMPGVISNCNDGLGRSPFHLAAMKGHEYVLRQLISQSIEQRSDKFGLTPLHLAAYFGHAKVVQLLLEQVGQTRLQLKSPDDEGYTPVHLATFVNRKEVLEVILERSDCMDAFEMELRDGMTPLHIASKLGYAEVVNLICGKLIEVNPMTSIERFTPLHLAANYGHDLVIQFLLQRNDLQVDRQDALGRTALHYAARQGQEAAANILLNCPFVAVDANDASGFTPLHLAAAGGHLGVVRMLLAKDANVNAKAGASMVFKSLLDAAWCDGKLLLSKMLLDAHLGSSDKMTSLHFAARNGHMAVVLELLRNRNIEIFPMDANGLTPQDWAQVRGCQEEFIRCLQDAGATYQESSLSRECLKAWRDKRAMEEKVFTPLLNKRFDTAARPSDFILSGRHMEIGLKWAASRGHRDVVEQLLDEQEIDVNEHDEVGNTPLHLAAKHGHTDVVELLSNRKSVDPNVRNSEGKTPLELAFEGNHVETCKTLLKHQQEVNENSLNWLLRRAIENDWFEMSNVLVFDPRTRVLEQGVKKGKTPLTEALTQPNRKHYAMLLQRRPSVKKRLFEERQTYMDSANANLVGAALIASVTYQGWLQPPQSRQHHWALTLFWWLNGGSFYSAIATMIAAAGGSLPTSDTQLVEAVAQAKMSATLSCLLLTISATFVIWGFAAAGFASAWEQKSLVVEMGLGSVFTMLLLLWFLIRSLKFLRGRTWWDVVAPDFSNRPNNGSGDSLGATTHGTDVHHELNIPFSFWEEGRQRDRTPMASLRWVLTEADRVRKSAVVVSRFLRRSISSSFNSGETNNTAVCTGRASSNLSFSRESNNSAVSLGSFGSAFSFSGPSPVTIVNPRLA